MSLTLEIPAEIENEIREAAQREGRDFSLYIIEAASEKARRGKAQETERLARSDAALDKITRLTEESRHDDWQLDALLDELEVPGANLPDEALKRASFYED